MKRYKTIVGPWLPAALVLLITANVIMGIVLMMQSRSAMRTLIRERMLDISNSAAGLLDGDTLKTLKAEDKDTEIYDRQKAILGTFQENIELEYIYAIREGEDGGFYFLIDPDDDPGQYDEQIKTTDALLNAAAGKADVDKIPYTDRWGRFYSAYSPVYDSEGNIAAIVAVDFAADWYDNKISMHRNTIILVCLLSFVIGIIISVAISARIRGSFKSLYNDMNSLKSDFEDLAKLIRIDSEERRDMMEGTDKQPPISKHDDETDLSGGSENDAEKISSRIREIQNDLRQYLAYVHSQAYTDAMTGVRNKTAYLSTVNHINKQIEEKRAVFAVAVFDINGLKTVNDNYGHEVGDKLIIDAANLLKQVFGAEAVYRIGGDEFIAVLEGKSLGDMNRYIGILEGLLDNYNDLPSHTITLAISKGADAFSAENDTEFREVFKRADQAMYRNKENYYRSRKRTDN